MNTIQYKSVFVSYDIVQFITYCRHTSEFFSPRGITLRSFLSSVVLFSFIWIATNYMYARALINLSATDVTALFSSAPVFVFVLSIFVLQEPPLLLRVGIIYYVVHVCILVYSCLQNSK